MENNKIWPTFKVKHLVVLGIFLMALALRLAAASRLNMTQPEADILINLTRHPEAQSGCGSILYQLLTLPLVQVFGTGNLVVRFWVVVAGALLVLVPLLFEDRLGTKTAVVLSALMALDPFQNANSLQINGSLLTLYTLALSVGLFHKKKYLPAVLAFIAFLLSGQQIVYALWLGIFVILTLFVQKRANVITEFFRVVWGAIRENSRILIAVLVGLLLVSFMLKIQLSDILDGFLAVFTAWGQPYALGSYPQLYPIALLSYLPLGFICLLFPAKSAAGKQCFPYLLTWSLAELLFIALNPGHQILDLVWVSSALCVIAAINLNEVFDQFSTYTIKVRIYSIVIICLLISLSITAIMLIYQIQYGLDMVSNLLSTISLLIVITMIVLFLAYNETVPLALTALRSGLVVVMVIFQIAFSWRALGLNGSPAQEILWTGYFEGAEMTEDIIQNADLSSLDADVDMSVGFINYPNDAVKWELGRKFPVVEKTSGLADQHLAVLITETRDGLSGNMADGYYGQDFDANSSPLWIWQPIKSLGDTDFWFWLIFRQGQMMRESNFIWVNKTLF